MNFKLKRRGFRLPIITPRRLTLMLCVAALLMIGIFTYESLVTDTATDTVKKEAVSVITEEVNNAVNDYLSKSGDFSKKCFTPIKDGSGRIISYSVNSEALSNAESTIVKSITTSLREDDVFEICIPIGTLSKIKLFSGRGFPVNVKVYSVSSVRSNIESTIESVGINQSLYKITLRLDVSSELIFRDSNEIVELTLKRTLAEKIIIGGVPLT